MDGRFGRNKEVVVDQSPESSLDAAQEVLWMQISGYKLASLT